MEAAQGEGVEGGRGVVGVNQPGGFRIYLTPHSFTYHQGRQAEVEGAEGSEAWEEQGVSAEVTAETEARVVAREGLEVHWGRADGGWWSDSRCLPRRVRGAED